MTQTAAASRQSMRAFLAALEGAGELRRIPERVDRDFEIAACLAEDGGGAAL
jgi:UbiD family decarboxylase